MLPAASLELTATSASPERPPLTHGPHTVQLYFWTSGSVTSSPPPPGIHHKAGELPRSRCPVCYHVSSLDRLFRAPPARWPTLHPDGGCPRTASPGAPLQPAWCVSCVGEPAKLPAIRHLRHRGCVGRRRRRGELPARRLRTPVLQAAELTGLSQPPARRGRCSVQDGTSLPLLFPLPPAPPPKLSVS